MWSSPKQVELYHKASRLKNAGYYEQSLIYTEQLLAEVKENSLSYAYAQGCVRAVNLRHLSKPEEAEADFSAAYELADRIADGQAIAAYVLNDWASMYEAGKNIEMVEAAIRKLETEGVTTPDLERFMPADLVYFEATLAKMHAQMDIPGAAKHMTDARRSFKVRMQGLPRYEDAFLVILGWECQMNLRNPTRLISPAARFLVTALRQGKQRELLKLLLEPAYRAGILGR